MFLGTMLYLIIYLQMILVIIENNIYGQSVSLYDHSLSVLLASSIVLFGQKFKSFNENNVLATTV